MHLSIHTLYGIDVHVTIANSRQARKSAAFISQVSQWYFPWFTFAIYVKKKLCNPRGDKNMYWFMVETATSWQYKIKSRGLKRQKLVYPRRFPPGAQTTVQEALLQVRKVTLLWEELLDNRRWRVSKHSCLRIYSGCSKAKENSERYSLSSHAPKLQWKKLQKQPYNLQSWQSS